MTVDWTTGTTGSAMGDVVAVPDGEMIEWSLHHAAIEEATLAAGLKNTPITVNETVGTRSTAG